MITCVACEHAKSVSGGTTTDFVIRIAMEMFWELLPVKFVLPRMHFTETWSLNLIPSEAATLLLTGCSSERSRRIYMLISLVPLLFFPLNQL